MTHNPGSEPFPYWIVEGLPVIRPLRTHSGKVDPLSSSCRDGQCDLPESFHQEDVPFGVLDSREEKSVAVRREAGPPDDEQAGHARNLVDTLSDKVEPLERTAPQPPTPEDTHA